MDTDKKGSQTLMGLAVLCLVVAGVLLFVGPKNEAGRMTWWWYLIIPCGVVLWLAGQKRRSGGKVYSRIKSVDESKAELESALSTGSKETEAKAHFDLGIAYQASYHPPRRGEEPDYTPLDKAIEHLSLAHDLYEEVENSDKKGQTLSNLGIIYYAKNQDEVAVKHFYSALNIAKSLDFPAWESPTMRRFSKLLGAMGRFSEADALITEYSVRRATRKRKV